MGKTKRKWLDARADAADESFLVATGFDAAIQGVAYTHEGPRVIYDIPTCLRVLRAQGMSEFDAEEYFDFNVLGAHVGPQTPLFMDCAPAAR